METFVLLVFAAVAAIAALLELPKRQNSKQETTNRDFIRFRNNYVLVYALMMGADDAPVPPVHRFPSLNAYSHHLHVHLRPHSSLQMQTSSSSHRHVRVQRAIGCKAPMFTPCTSTTVLIGAK